MLRIGFLSAANETLVYKENAHKSLVCVAVARALPAPCHGVAKA